MKNDDANDAARSEAEPAPGPEEQRISLRDPEASRVAEGIHIVSEGPHARFSRARTLTLAAHVHVASLGRGRRIGHNSRFTNDRLPFHAK